MSAERKEIVLTAASVSDRGLVRAENQDHHYEDLGRSVFCVADGMGGGQGGAKASEIVCAHVAGVLEGTSDYASRVDGVVKCLQSANLAIQRFAQKSGYDQMATTVVATVFDVDSARVSCVHVGDSRLYRWRDGKLDQLTVDHTVSEELSRRADLAMYSAQLRASSNPYSHVLTRAIGIGETVESERSEHEVRPGDRYLLCSDGIYDMLGEDGLTNVFNLGGSPRASVARLQALTVREGAEDNYTAIVVKVD